MKSAEIFVVILTISAGYILAQSVVSPPTDVTGLLGDGASFDCEVAFGAIEKLTWKFNGKSVYSMLDAVEKYPEGSNKYFVNKAGDRFTLHIKDLGFLDGGEYTCSTFMAKATAVLTVLGFPSITSDPSDPVEGEKANYKCEARFGGPNNNSTGPMLQVFLDNRPLNDYLPESEISYKADIHQLTMTFDLKVDSGFNDKQLKCEIGTTASGIKSTTSTVLNVLYPVRDVAFSPQHTEYEVGSHLTCSANGNPSPSYEWKNLIGRGNIGKHRRLNVTEDMLGKNEWKCTANNFIREEPHENHIIANFDAFESSTDDSSGSSVIIGVIFTFIIIIGALGIVVYKFREKIINYIRNRMNRRPLEHNECEEGVNQCLMQKIDAQKCAEIIKNNPSKEELDIHGKSILNWLKEEGKAIFECDPDILLVMIQKASILMESNDYIDIIKEMVISYNTVPHTPESCPLQCLNQQMLNAEECEVLMKHQSKFLSLIQAVTVADFQVQARTECLGNLIFLSEYVSVAEVKLKWSTEFFAILKHLLNEGADPNWIPYGSFSNERHSRMSAQDRFFLIIFYIILEKENLFSSIMEIMPLFLAKKCTILEHLRGTVLHALVEPRWYIFQEKNPPSTFFHHYKEILSEVLRHDPSLVDKRDYFERTPLHAFMDKFYVPGSFLKETKECALLLKSNDNIKAKDQNGQTVLHYLAKAFPSLPQLKSHEEIKTFLDLVRNLASDSNVCMQDKKGRTALHLLANSYNKEVPNHDWLIQLMEIFKDAANIKDNHGHTALHIIAKKCDEPSNDCSVLRIVELLLNKTNSIIKDKKGRTVLDIIGDKFRKLPQKDQTEFMKINNFLSGYPSASIK